MERLEATGKSVEIAIQNGLLECGLKREDVEVKVIDQGGMFKKAKVVLTWGQEEQIEEKIEEAPIEKVEEKTESVKDVEEKTKVVEELPKKIIDSTRLETKCNEFLTTLAKKFDENATIVCEKKDNELSFSVNGENMSRLIGFHGDTISSIQLLLNNFKLRSEGAIRVFVDIDGYKSNRNQTIIELANRMAEQAIKIERNIHLDPMNAYDRRIVHTTLQDRPNVTTESTGEGEKRHVVIKPIF